MISTKFKLVLAQKKNLVAYIRLVGIHTEKYLVDNILKNNEFPYQDSIHVPLEKKN